MSLIGLFSALLFIVEKSRFFHRSSLKLHVRFTVWMVMSAGNIHLPRKQQTSLEWITTIDNWMRRGKKCRSKCERELKRKRENSLMSNANESKRSNEKSSRQTASNENEKFGWNFMLISLCRWQNEARKKATNFSINTFWIFSPSDCLFMISRSRDRRKLKPTQEWEKEEKGVKKSVAAYQLKRKRENGERQSEKPAAKSKHSPCAATGNVGW